MKFSVSGRILRLAIPVERRAMKTIEQMFLEHPEAVGETYFEHLHTASSFGGKMILAGIACLLHGVFPFLFVRTGSRAIGELHSTMVANRFRAQPKPGTFLGSGI